MREQEQVEGSCVVGLLYSHKNLLTPRVVGEATVPSMSSLQRMLVLLLALLCGAEAWGASMGAWARRAAASTVVVVGLPLISLAAVDCQKDCVKNCLIAAPNSGEYCTSSCSEYCDDPDREDGLSGSKSAAKGETGLFGGSIDGTTIKDLPPKSPFSIIDPKLSSFYGISTQRMKSDALHQ